MRRLLICALVSFTLGALLVASGLYSAGVIMTKRQLEYYTCPLLKYRVVGEGNTAPKYREWKHDLNNDGKADVVALYVYSKTLKRWIELDREYIGGRAA